RYQRWARYYRALELRREWVPVLADFGPDGWRPNRPRGFVQCLDPPGEPVAQGRDPEDGNTEHNNDQKKTDIDPRLNPRDVRQAPKSTRGRPRNCLGFQAG